VAATIVNTTLYFDASAREGMSKVKAIPFRSFAFGIALLKVFFPRINVRKFSFENQLRKMRLPKAEKLIFKSAQCLYGG